MAQVPTNGQAFASPSPSLDVENVRAARNPSFGNDKSDQLDARMGALLMTPPTSVSPDMPAHGTHVTTQTPPPINIEHEVSLGEGGTSHAMSDADPAALQSEGSGTPLSKGALSGLDATAAITPIMLARDYLPGILVGSGSRAIREVMAVLTQDVPGFSGIPATKARRLVVAALEGRRGGGPDGSVTFRKAGWGRWGAYIKGSSSDSGICSYNDSHVSVPRSERSSFAVSNDDSGVHMPGPRLGTNFRGQPMHEALPESGLGGEDELEMDMDVDMDVAEDEADKMSLGEEARHGFDANSDDTVEDDSILSMTASELRELREDHWARMAKGPRVDYQALMTFDPPKPNTTPASRRIPPFNGTPPQGGHRAAAPRQTLDAATATPDEQDAASALMKLGSM